MKKLFSIIALAVVILALCWFHFSAKRHPTPEVIAIQTNVVSAGASPFGAINTNPAPEIDALARSLKSNSDPQESFQSVKKLREHLDSLGTEAASRTVQQWLDSGADSPTHLDFKLSQDGSLKEAPTLRTFLLDYLAQVDPKAAAAYAEKILGTQNSPDEWAVALRAYARGNTTPEAGSFLQQKIREMLGNKEWRDHPSVGFLEAFDVIVHTRDKELTPELGGMIQQKENRALAHAAYLTLDRLVQATPTDVLGQLQTQPDLMEGHEKTRADFFARADVRDAQQKTLLENYLLDPKRSGPELQQFAGVYPNANYMVSHNLLTQVVTPTGDELAARDREALITVQQWLDDPGFAKLKPQLQTIKTRLEQFVKQSGGSQP